MAKLIKLMYKGFQVKVLYSSTYKKWVIYINNQPIDFFGNSKADAVVEAKRRIDLKLGEGTIRRIESHDNSTAEDLIDELVTRKSC